MSLKRAKDGPSSREKRAGFLHQKSPLVEISGFADELPCQSCHARFMLKFCTGSNSNIVVVIVSCCFPLTSQRTTLKKVRGAIGKKNRRLSGYNLYQKECKNLVKNCHVTLHM